MVLPRAVLRAVGQGRRVSRLAPYVRQVATTVSRGAATEVSGHGVRMHDSWRDEHAGFRARQLLLSSLALLSLQSHNALTEEEDKKEKGEGAVYGPDQAIVKIKSQLQEFRRRRWPNSKPPPIMVSSEPPFTVQVPLPGPHAVAPVLAKVIDTFEKHGVDVKYHATTLSLAPGEPSTVVFLLDQGGRTTSFSILTPPVGAFGPSMLKFNMGTEGFTDAHIDAIVAGYQAAFGSSFAPGDVPVLGFVDISDPDEFQRMITEGFRGFPDLRSALEGEFGFGAMEDHRGRPVPRRDTPAMATEGAAQASDKAAILERLHKAGAEVYEPGSGELDWESLAGYEDIKRQIEDTLLMALKHPEVFDEVAKKTRARFESPRPRAILFEGPPGCGKTLTARIIANLAGVPLVYVPVERIMSKWFGESENRLKDIFEAASQLGGALIFIDEIDALATSRDNEQMHEATRRLLSVILQAIEGFNSSRAILICATNRKRDLDPALISRFDTSIRFDPPEMKARMAIFKRYAKHLKDSELEILARETEGASCRDIKDICENTERRWASKLIRGEVKEETPPLGEYLLSVRDRLCGFRLVKSEALSGAI